MLLQAPKGTKDMLPSAAYKWHYIENLMKDIVKSFGVREIRTPIFEHTELFTRGVGETTDVVQKEMYTFNDKGDRSITLKPEGTAGAARAFIENSLYNEVQPTKMFYFTPVFRYEKMQKGRLREHHQFGVEFFGSNEGSTDVEVISIAMRIPETLGIKNLELNINNIGCNKCRPKYNEALKEYFKDYKEELCGVCKDRLEKNPLRILDCKNKKCNNIAKDAPIILDYVCGDCNSHFNQVKEYLTALNINFKVDPYIVRGLDYYTSLVFEIINKDYTICGGGRYNNLIEEIGGKETGAVGFGMGLERLLLNLEDEGIEIEEKPYIDLYIGAMDNLAKIESLILANKLRSLDIKCEIDHLDKSVKAQMKYANKINSRFSIILGENELKSRTANLKNMVSGETIEVSFDDLGKIKEIIFL